MLSWNPKFAVRTAKRFLLRILYNWRIRSATFRAAAHLIFNDGAHYRQMQIYYIRPQAQLEALQANFVDIRIFALATGAELKDPDEVKRNEDVWLYYLCRFK